MINIQSLIDSNNIQIISGEGEVGTTDKYTGKRSLLAIKRRLTKERCHGDRWAKAVVYSHSNDYGDVYVNINTGEYY